MPRPSEIAADARALYGPPSVRPAAGAMGDGALWVDPGDSQSLWQVQSGNWRQIALPPADDDSSIPAGIPILRGPYVADYAMIPHDGDKVTLWTPTVGDVLLRLFPDWQTVTQWDHGNLYIGQNVDGNAYPAVGVLDFSAPGEIGRGGVGGLDTLLTGMAGQMFDATGAQLYATAYVFHSTAAVQVQLALAGAPDEPTQGHVALYALIARAVAP